MTGYYYLFVRVGIWVFEYLGIWVYVCYSVLAVFFHFLLIFDLFLLVFIQDLV